MVAADTGVVFIDAFMEMMKNKVVFNVFNLIAFGVFGSVFTVKSKFLLTRVAVILCKMSKLLAKP